jgi:hypothetical protein
MRRIPPLSKAEHRRDGWLGMEVGPSEPARCVGKDLVFKIDAIKETISSATIFPVSPPTPFLMG